MGLFSRLRSKKKGKVEEKATEALQEAEPAAAPSPYRFKQPAAGQSASPAALLHHKPAGFDDEPLAAHDVDLPSTDAVAADGVDGEAFADAASGPRPDHIDPAAAEGDAALSSPLEPSAGPATPDVGSPVTPAGPAESAEEAGPPDSSCGSCDVHAAGYAASERSAGSSALPVGRPALGRASPSGSLCSEQSSAAASRTNGGAGGAGSGGQQLSAQRQIRAEMGEEAEARLREIFSEYASFGTSKQRLEELDSARFYKLAKECGLLSRRFSKGHADVAFTAAKRRKELRRLTFGEFCTALRLAAFYKRCPLQQVVSQVLGSSGPALNNVTEAETVRLYDDLSTWTGTQFQVAAEAALAGPQLASTGSGVPSSGYASGTASGLVTPNPSRAGSLAELLARQLSGAPQEFIDPAKAAAEAAEAEKRRREARGQIREAEAAAAAAVARAAQLEAAAKEKAQAAAAAAAAAKAAIGENQAAVEARRAEAAALQAQAAAQEEAARQAERDAAAALRKAAQEEENGRVAAEAALAVATEKQRLATEAATNAWAEAAAASEAAVQAAAAAESAAAAAADEQAGWSEDSRRQVEAAQAEAEAASMAAIQAAKRDAEAAMVEALMRAEEAEATVEAARSEASAAAEALEAAKAECAALLAAAAAAEAAAENHAGRKKEAEAKAVALKEAAAAAAVQRRKAAARAKQDAERAAADAAERRAAAAEAAQQAANAAVRAQAAINSRLRAQQKLAEALSKAHASRLAAALSAPATPEQQRAAAAPPPVSPEQAAADALEAARERFGDGSAVSNADLKRVWTEFATFGKRGDALAHPRMESNLFFKLCKECWLLNEGLTPPHVDLTFSKVVPDKARSIGFKQFLQALPLLAAARGCEVDEVRLLVAAADGPMRRGTTPLAVRFHDCPGGPK
ncbi:hypothetical protein ABPG77_000586 [Micractinium sp. CCAP 211/92]